MSDLADLYPGCSHICCGACDGKGTVGTFVNLPDECCQCDGSGRIWCHEKSRVVAKWPGGSFLGKADHGHAR